MPFHGAHIPFRHGMFSQFTAVFVCVSGGWFMPRVRWFGFGALVLLLATGAFLALVASTPASRWARAVDDDGSCIARYSALTCGMLPQIQDPPADRSSQTSGSESSGAPAQKSVVLGKSVGARASGPTAILYRIAVSSVALPSALWSTLDWQSHAGVRAYWPMGRSASESVVLLRRLLI